MLRSTATDEWSHHIRSRGQGRRLRVLTDLVEIRISGDESGGAYALVEVQSPPLGGAVELHAHPVRESLFVLEGLYEVRGLGSDGPYVIRASAGDLVRIAPGAPHSYQNLGETPGRLLALYEPPTGVIDLFEALHSAVEHPEPLEAPPEALPGLERTRALYTRHGVSSLTSSGTALRDARLATSEG